MKLPLIKKCLLTIAFLFPFITSAANIDKLVVFGDSLSDHGNAYALSKRLHAIDHKTPIMPISPPYYDGRFSNGPTWAEDLAASWHIKLLDYAYGGAWAQGISVSHQIIPGLNQQVDKYIFTHPIHNKDKAIYILWIGANDYLNNQGDINAVTDQVIAAIQQAIEKLIKNGAASVFLINLPDIGQSPHAIQMGPAYATMLTKLALLHNQKLATMIEQEQQYHPDVKMAIIDIYQLFTSAITNPQAYHLVDVNNSCYDGGYYNHNSKLAYQPMYQICDNPNTYLFWDHIHPTAYVHQIIANYVANSISVS